MEEYFFEKVLDEQGDVRPAFPDGRNEHREHVEPVIEGLHEMFRLSLLLRGSRFVAQIILKSL